MPRWSAILLLAVVPSLRAQAPAPAKPVAPARESTEWLDIFITETQNTTLPRVLLIGDSITRAYFPQVQELLKGRAVVGRIATSKSAGDPAYLTELAMLLAQYRFDIVHFNNGMHGDGYTEAAYAQGLRDARDLIRRAAPNARLIVATTTPVRRKNDLEHLDPKTDRIRQRNLSAREVFAPGNTPVDDLFTLMLPHPEDYSPDGVHANPAGVQLEARQVAATIAPLLP